MPDLKVDLQALVDRINATSNADFVRRLLSGNKKHIIDENGDRLTHRLGYVESDGRAIVFPDVQSDGDTLKEYPFPQSLNRAVDRQDTVMMSIPEAEAFTAGYKEYYPQAEFKSGGGIHIKPSHRGRLTKLKKRTGKSEAELYNDGNPAHKKMVVFARNARKWKHDDGGLLENVADYDIDINYNNNIRVPEDWNEALLRTIGENLLISEENAGNIEKKKKVPFLQRVANAAILAENPAVATASGISLDERTGELLQNPDAPGAKELRKNLAVLTI